MNIEKAIEVLESRERNYKINKKLGVVDNMTEEGKEMGEAAGIILRFLRKQQEKIRFKNEIIDEMANYIGEEDISETFCTTNKACDEGCKNCVKQYFEKKVEQN